MPEKDNPARIKVFEIYRDADACKAHLESVHFKKYKAATEKMVKSLRLIQTAPIMLGAASSTKAYARRGRFTGGRFARDHQLSHN